VNVASIFACTDPRRAQWQLGRLPPAAGRMTLIGWAQEPEPVDDGVPREVGAVLARALVSVSRVTFPSSVLPPPVTAGWSKLGDDDVRRLDATVAGRVAAVVKGTPAHVAGLLSLTAGFDDVLLRALEYEAKLALFRWSVLTEEDLIRR
jgi:hypothetical protein